MWRGHSKTVCVYIPSLLSEMRRISRVYAGTELSSVHRRPPRPTLAKLEPCASPPMNIPAALDVGKFTPRVQLLRASFVAPSGASSGCRSRSPEEGSNAVTLRPCRSRHISSCFQQKRREGKKEKRARSRSPASSRHPIKATNEREKGYEEARPTRSGA